MTLASPAACEALELLDVLDLLLSEAKYAEEKRSELRIPFFRPVAVHQDDSPGGPLSAFSRDLSPMGIGLLHTEPIAPGEVTVSIPVDRDAPVRLRTRIKWCHPCGEGWYLSGGPFIRVDSSDD